jgi:hypothetical protein
MFVLKPIINIIHSSNEPIIVSRNIVPKLINLPGYFSIHQVEYTDLKYP